MVDTSLFRKTSERGKSITSFILLHGAWCRLSSSRCIGCTFHLNSVLLQLSCHNPHLGLEFFLKCQAQFCSSVWRISPLSFFANPDGYNNKWAHNLVYRLATQLIPRQEKYVHASTIACASKEQAQESRIYACNGYDNEKEKGSQEYDQSRFKNRWWLWHLNRPHKKSRQ